MSSHNEKERQRRLLKEMMEADERDGLYEHEANVTPFTDLMESALKDYDEASRAVCHFNSDIPKAIKFYYEHKINQQKQ